MAFSTLGNEEKADILEGMNGRKKVGYSPLWLELWCLSLVCVNM